MAVTKRLRFEILRRDNFTCRYCGSSAPDVKLAVDHVNPVALGGTDEPSNLVTACNDCNTGKSSTSPDAPLVEDINRAAGIWNAALAQAQREAIEQFDHHEQLSEYFFNEWTVRLPSFATLPEDWDTTIVDFYTRGLNTDALSHAMDITASKRGVIAQRAMWNYFCGICWNKLRDIEDRAREIIDNGELENG